VVGDKMSDTDLSIKARRLGYNKDVTQLRKEISLFTNVSCLPEPHEHVKNKVMEVVPGGKIDGSACSTDTMTFDETRIIPEQYRDWAAHYMAYPPESKAGDLSIYSNIVGSPNPEFETCMNNILTKDPKIDLVKIQSLKEVQSFTDVSDDHIEYMHEKMRMFLIDSHKQTIVDCIKDDLNLDVSVCDAGLGEQMIKIVAIVSYIIGFKLSDIDHKNPQHVVKLNKMIQTFGPLLKVVLERIIELTEIYESQYCSGTSHKTKIMRTLHDNVFSSTNPVFNFDMGLSKLTSRDETNDTEFSRSIMLMMMGIAFLKYF